MKTRMVHRCSECGGESPRWLGRCPACDAWGTLVEQVDTSRAPRRRRGPRPRRAVRCRSATSTRGPPSPCPTGVAELDRVLEGGLVPGSVYAARRGSRAWARARCCSRRSAAWPPAARRACSSRPRSRARRCASGPSGVGALDARAAGRGRDVAAARARPRRRGRPAGARARLDPDRRRSRPPRRARFGHPGARLRLPAGAAGEGAVAGHRARRPRHQGGHRRRAAGARARGRHRALVRRRPRSLAAHCCTR